MLLHTMGQADDAGERRSNPRSKMLLKSHPPAHTQPVQQLLPTTGFIAFDHSTPAIASVGASIFLFCWFSFNVVSSGNSRIPTSSQRVIHPYLVVMTTTTFTNSSLIWHQIAVLGGSFRMQGLMYI